MGVTNACVLDELDEFLALVNFRSKKSGAKLIFVWCAIGFVDFFRLGKFVLLIFYTSRVGSILYKASINVRIGRRRSIILCEPFQIAC
jgi:hypothetical protein